LLSEASTEKDREGKRDGSRSEIRRKSSICGDEQMREERVNKTVWTDGRET
jgi:hypothetical protein